MTKPLTAPFPYFGGKRRAAPMVWALLGDPGGYVEPFAGSAAVLLARPPFKGRRVETVNDADGWLVNAWRAIQHDPDEVAAHCYGPVTEIDYHARLAWLNERRDDDLVAWLEGDPENHDPRAAGWWLYVMAAGIGDPFGGGPWKVVDGLLVDSRTSVTRAGASTVNSGNDDARKLPHLGDAGQGVNRKLPHLGNAGQGVNRGLPHLGNAGQGVNRGLPHLGDAGQGVNRELPHLGDAGQGIALYLRQLAQRLERVRITCGTWTRVVQPSVTRSKTGGDGSCAMLLDPPYTIGDYYAANDGTDIAAQVADWCLNAPADMRIVLCGFDTDNDTLLAHGWTKHLGRSGGGAGYAKDGKAGRRERLWASPECLNPEQESLFEVAL